MNLVLSDRPLLLPPTGRGTELVDLSALRIAPCTGCFGCWIKTPGRCVIRDDAIQVYPKIAASCRVLYVSRVCYGGYDTVMKTMLERAIPIQQAFIRLVHEETHHVQRAVRPKQAVILGYGPIPQEEQALFARLIARNARNMCFDQFRVRFAPEAWVEQAAREEVLAWTRS